MDMRALGLTNDNVLINKERLLYALTERYGLSIDHIQEIIKVLQDNPDRDKDKKAVMRKTGRESSINTTTGQGLGSVIDNMPYYVDSCCWWLNGWNSTKYLKRLAKPRRKPVPRIANRLKVKGN